MNILESSVSSYSNSDINCAICLDTSDDDHAHRMVGLNCGHFFGRSCIVAWADKELKCPLCKNESFPRDLSGNNVSIIKRYIQNHVVSDVTANRSMKSLIIMSSLHVTGAAIDCYSLIYPNNIVRNAVGRFLDVSAPVLLPLRFTFGVEGCAEIFNRCLYNEQFSYYFEKIIVDTPKMLNDLRDALSSG
ncbi:RING finger domain-containing protein [uncultured Endozoicomonas sp.]|uniref:RING finger domain-containing protein n=1 Tax=uncultured Endozoicomonas sp. TaxID=432652 RepID=UPI00262FA3D6|nr:RING finger domain-containing protein [uncultured Endozoicomonas sp.]